ncbi:MAG: YchJ family protein [Planctomycetes bacterium]|nr:YchJ family protein [Planctomycetota bacterium]
MNDEACPCQSGHPYAECCGPLLSGARLPATAEALMRSRYTAYTRSDLAYLRETLHSKSRDTFDEANTKQWAAKSEWRGLEILRTEHGGEDEEAGTVEFVAKYRNEGNDIDHHEVAEFKREGGVWKFVDGRVMGLDPIRRDSEKVGRNDPCPCGSGKKHKKCCGRG